MKYLYLEQFRKENKHLFGVSRTRKHKLKAKKNQQLLKKYFPLYQRFNLLVRPVSTNPRLYLLPKRQLTDENLMNEKLARARRGTLKNSTQMVNNQCPCCINNVPKFNFGKSSYNLKIPIKTEMIIKQKTF